MDLNNVGSFYIVSRGVGNKYPNLTNIGNSRCYATKSFNSKDFEIFFNKDKIINTTKDNAINTTNIHSDVLKNNANLNNVKYEDISILKGLKK